MFCKSNNAIPTSQSKTFTFRNFKRFDVNKFLSALNVETLITKFNSADLALSNLTCVQSEKEHCKKRILDYNHATSHDLIYFSWQQYFRCKNEICF